MIRRVNTTWNVQQKRYTLEEHVDEDTDPDTKIEDAAITTHRPLKTPSPNYPNYPVQIQPGTHLCRFITESRGLRQYQLRS